MQAEEPPTASMLCPSCHAANDDTAEACFTCGKAFLALTLGTVLCSRYEILRPLGRGGMGMVYQARDRVLGGDVAIKVLRSEIAWDAEMAQRFRTEIRLARKVSHKNVCRIHEYGEEGSIRFITMELVEGANLKDLLREGPLPPERAFDVSVQLAEGLQAVHEHGVIHRDFKPANVMIDGRGVVRLMDFGIAKEVGADRSSPTASGHILGTPEYMSPEQTRGAVDFRSDVYSLGCVLYEIFSGRAPLKGETPAATILNHLNEPPPLEGGAAAPIPPSVRPVLRRALAKNPEARFASAGELAGALREARVQAGVEAPSAPLPPPAASGPPGAATGLFETATLWRRRSRVPLAWVWSAVAAGMAAVVTLPLTAPRTSTGPADSPAPEVPAASGVPSFSPPVPSAPNLAETRPEPSVAAVEPGRLTLLVVPPAEVTIDGSSVGVVSLRHLSLAPGAHVLRVLHPDYQPLQRKVSVQSGLESKLVLDLAEKAIPRSP